MSRGPASRGLIAAGGIALMVLGALLVFTPGPGLVVFLAGAALLARESPRAARWLDGLKLRLRGLLRR
jgi:hypothetical protein